ncbi:MAG: cysteine--tRNA ligase [Desulfobacteraceae bacterium]|nr:cysteine--tRNA ligase [Desulfobacteraceae bacterium]
MLMTLIDLIGNTPLVRIQRMNPNPRVQIYAKLEYLNPGGSVKDRAALSMIEAAERSGELTPQKTVVEATSGNTGIGLAMVCSVKGYKLLLAMSESASVERQKILKARGAEILLTPGHLGTDGAIEEAYRLARQNPDAYFVTDQFNNPANWQAHYHGTANEIWEQTKGAVTLIVATLGTSGTLMGLSRRLKELNPDVQIVGVEPYLGHKIQGLKNMKESYQPEIYEKERLDRKVNVDDEHAFETARQLARQEGLFVGMSSGAAMAAALSQAQMLDKGVIVVVLPDSGERYLSTTLFVEKEQVGLSLFNTRSRSKEVFKPLIGGKVSVYTNGPTAHALMHAGEARRFVFADLVDRYLCFRGYNVQHVMNITDLDDKTYQGADKAKMPAKQFAGQNIDAFEKDRDFLGIRPAAHYPRSSDHIDDMVLAAQQLVGKGHAYEKLQSLYFDISSYKKYGQLSGIDLNKIKLGATVDLDDYEKDNPRDFTLLKRVRLSELKKGLYTKTQWGNVRPSWPLQCAVLAMKYLGESCDIHIAGRELMFPLHENEIAIAGALNKKPLTRFWLHCDTVLAGGKKLDGNDNGLTIRSLTEKGWTGREIRLWLLSSHYRRPVVYSNERLQSIRSCLHRLDTCVQSLEQVRNGRFYDDLNQMIYDLKNDFITAMDDDLNISAGMAAIFRFTKKINRLVSNRQISDQQVPKILDAFKHIDLVLNIFQFNDEHKDPKVQALLDERARARQSRNWKLADQIREKLHRMGIVVRDTKSKK